MRQNVRHAYAYAGATRRTSFLGRFKCSIPDGLSRLWL